MEPIPPDVMVRQVESLSGDLRRLTADTDERIRELLAARRGRTVREVILVGSGDSHHAGQAAELAFRTLGGVRCTPLSTLRFLAYGGTTPAGDDPGQTLVVGVSASGNTPLVVRSLEQARQRGAATLAVTGTQGSRVTTAAEQAVVVDVADRERSPGIRTYQANLLALLLLAVRLGGSPEGDGHVDEIASLGVLIDETLSASRAECRRVAGWCATAEGTMLLGSGPSYGTALYAAAKLVEAAGIGAAGQDVEEWCHVERFAYPVDAPLFVVAPPGRGHDRAAEVAQRAHKLGRRVVAVARPDDEAITAHAAAVLPVPGDVREEFSPLVYHGFASYLAAATAEALGRALFQSDRR
ncbi:SIS domain-containing protein [Micromonospora sp. RTGN7]|uniref:SIS domain-containing protein n=1 Tax=Micromonospora sp. RTGN7 TaxID=3016526 RepID=UPI0029FECF5A|nr:SIS domain-containing protein [Micromonospora sp. RTGN7]